ncbi:MAG: radical SAM protein [Planctomycetaceae bacterium]|nr:radical SAM protein [Planctomycetaceae bacterium]
MSKSNNIEVMDKIGRVPFWKKAELAVTVRIKNGLAALTEFFTGIPSAEYTDRKRDRRIFVGRDGKVRIPLLGFQIAFGCNLKCEHCCLMNPFQSGVSSKEVLIDSFRRWSEILVPKKIYLSGGEPFLHPEITDVAAAVKRYFPHSRLDIITNAVLLPKIDDRILQTLARMNVHLNISIHQNTSEYLAALNQTLDRLRHFRLRYKTNDSFYGWQKFLETAETGEPIPANSNPATAWKNCSGHHCIAVIEDKLYRCNRLAYMIHALQAGEIGLEWSRVLSHKPVTPDNSPEEIRNYLRMRGMPECSVCPERPVQVPARQLSTEEVLRIKQHIRQKNKEAA